MPYRSFPAWGMSLGLGKFSIQHHRDLSISFLKMTVTRGLPDAYAPLQMLLKHQCFSVLHKLCRWWQAFPWGESGCSAALASLTQTQNSNIIGFYNLLTAHRCHLWQWIFTGVVIFKGDKCFVTCACHIYCFTRKQKSMSCFAWNLLHM